MSKVSKRKYRFYELLFENNKAVVVNIELKWGLSILDSASGVRFLFHTAAGQN